MRMIRLTAVVFFLVVGLATSAAPASGHEPAPVPVRMGMPASMFRDVNPVVFAGLARPFYTLVEMQTGLKSELLLIQTPDEMREQLDAGKLQLGVFHGFEFAWMKQKSPTLQALMVAAPQHRPLQALVVVNQDSPARTIADLKGKTVALPVGTREYVRLYLTRQCQALGNSPDAFFAQVTKPVNSDTSLHDVVDDKGVQAAIVDGGMFQNFTASYSGRAKRLRVLVSSDNFPESVVVYSPGKVDEDTIRRFRQGMSTAHATPLGRNLLALWSMAGFQPIPPNYQQQLTDCLKTFPPPADSVK
jgi:ABC-type phosphate/phosphonate transport system substrate-binding protein